MTVPGKRPLTNEIIEQFVRENKQTTLRKLRKLDMYDTWVRRIIESHIRVFQPTNLCSNQRNTKIPLYTSIQTPSSCPAKIKLFVANHVIKSVINFQACATAIVMKFCCVVIRK